MAKKSQTRARRNNTQVGPQVVNFYNHGTVNVDARQNNSTSTKYVHTNCTVNYTPQPGRPFTLKDQLEEGHPILGWVEPETVESNPSMTITQSPRGENKGTAFHKGTSWMSIAAIGATIAIIGIATVKYFNN